MVFEKQRKAFKGMLNRRKIKIRKQKQLDHKLNQKRKFYKSKYNKFLLSNQEVDDAYHIGAIGDIEYIKYPKNKWGRLLGRQKLQEKHTQHALSKK